MPTLEQVRAARKKMQEAQHCVFDYVQRPEPSRVDPEKYHNLSEAARKAANKYLRLAYDAYSKFKDPK